MASNSLNIVLVFDGRQSFQKSLKLNNEWTLCIETEYKNNVYFVKSLFLKGNPSLSVKESSISGELKVVINDEQIWKQAFSKFMKDRVLVTNIFNTLNPLYFFHNFVYYIRGYLDDADESLKNELLVKSLKNEEPKKAMHQECHEKLLKDLERLLDPNMSCFSDVILKCGDTSIPAHKNILSVRSPVFAAMFTNPMKENQENQVDIADIDASILRVLLRYLYTGNIDLNASFSADLFLAADKFMIQDLKEVCSSFLKNTVSLQNVVRTLVLGDMLDEDLKSFAVDYICNKCTEFSVLEATEEWKTLQKDAPDLAISVLTALVKAMNEKVRK